MSFCAISRRGGDKAVDGPYTAFISVFEPIDPVFLFGITDHLSVFISEFPMFLMDRVVKVMALDLMIYFSCEFADFVPLLQ